MDSTSKGIPRDRSVDVARGLAIVAIVVGHVERGLSSASLMAADTAQSLDRLLYLFHLATFAYLSGLFVARGVERDGARSFLAKRMTLFVWLYLLWTLVQGTVRVAASSVANTPVTLTEVLRLWVPEGQLWFLPWLIAVTAVAVAARPWWGGARAALSLTGAAALAILVWGYDPLYAFTRGWALLLPFLVGCAVQQRRHAEAFRHLRLVLVVTLVGGTVWLATGLLTDATPPTTGGAERTASTVALGVAGCLAGTAALLSAAAALARTPLAALICVLGRRSLEIFLAHIVVASGTRIVLVQLGVTVPWVHLVAGTTLGTIVPVGVAVVAERLGWSWLFGLPRWLAKISVRGAGLPQRRGCAQR